MHRINGRVRGLLQVLDEGMLYRGPMAGDDNHASWKVVFRRLYVSLTDHRGTFPKQRNEIVLKLMR